MLGGVPSNLIYEYVFSKILGGVPSNLSMNTFLLSSFIPGFFMGKGHIFRISKDLSEMTEEKIIGIDLYKGLSPIFLILMGFMNSR